jgi:hypothetical protein
VTTSQERNQHNERTALDPLTVAWLYGLAPRGLLEMSNIYSAADEVSCAYTTKVLIHAPRVFFVNIGVFGPFYYVILGAKR